MWRCSEGRRADLNKKQKKIKKITVSLRAWEKATEIRNREGISWDRLLLRAIGVSRELGSGQIVRDLEERKGEERFERREYCTGDLEPLTLYLSPEVRRRILEVARQQRRTPSELIEIFTKEKLFGPPRAPAPETEKLFGPPRAPAPETEKAPATPKINGRKLECQPVPGDNRENLTIAEEQWLQKRKEWAEESEQWKWFSSETLVWPEGAKARVLWQEEEAKGVVVRKIKGLFIYHFEKIEDLGFLEPYRLDFSIRKEISLEVARIFPDSYKLVSLRFKKRAQYEVALKDQASIFSQLEENEIGDRIG